MQRKGKGLQRHTHCNLCLLSVTTNKLLHGFSTYPLDCSPFFLLLSNIILASSFTATQLSMHIITCTCPNPSYHLLPHLFFSLASLTCIHSSSILIPLPSFYGDLFLNSFIILFWDHLCIFFFIKDNYVRVSYFFFSLTIIIRVFEYLVGFWILVLWTHYEINL